jgi:subtilase family serine protease
VGDPNLYVKARGTIADVQRAFHVELHQFDVHGQNYRANTTDPVIEGEAGTLVSRVGGLSDYRLQPHFERRVNPETGRPSPAAPLSATPAGAFYSPYCLEAPQTVNLTNGSNLTATYYGNSYGAPLSDTTLGTLAPCGYQPSELQAAYNLTPLYQHGLTGAGQTNVIVDAWGSPTIASDAALFSSFYGLGGLDLNTYELGESCSSTPNTTPALCQGWAGETTVDVDAVHTMAPGSTIALVETASDSVDDLTAGIAFAVSHDLGNVISNSWGVPESELEGRPYAPFDHILMMAAAHGISVNFSSGDYGDFYAFEGQIDVDYPASAPYATGIGGTSLVLNPDYTLAFQTGWGTNMTQISTPPDTYGYNEPLLPPDNSPADGLGFIYGAGGGASAVYRKPSFQRSLPGNHRMVPDISYVADPDTGMEILCTGSSCFGQDSSIYVAVYGGTSLSCQLFSGLWAIANQQSGRPLGQAARYVYDLPPNAVKDIVPFGSPFDARGSITSGTQTYYESAFQLVQPLESPAPFLSGLFQSSLTEAWYVISFGTDTTLYTRPGWDEVTGVGTPNAWEFVNAVTSHR